MSLSQEAARLSGITGLFRLLGNAVSKTAKGEDSARILLDPVDATVTVTHNLGTPKKPKPVEKTYTIKRLVKRINKAAELEKQVKKEKEFLQDAMRAFVEPIRADEATNGNYVKSFQVLGTISANGIQSALACEQQDGASFDGEAIIEDSNNLKVIDLIRTVVDNKETFYDLFASETLIGFRPTFVANKEKMAKLRTTLEGAGWSKEDITEALFSETQWSVKPGFREKLYKLPAEITTTILKHLTPFVDKLKDVSTKA